MLRSGHHAALHVCTSYIATGTDVRTEEISCTLVASLGYVLNVKHLESVFTLVGVLVPGAVVTGQLKPVASSNSSHSQTPVGQSHF